MNNYRTHNRIRIARIVFLCSSLAIVAMAGLLAQAKHAQPQDTKPAQPTATSDQDQDSEAGQKKFQANCSRCHDAPQQFSPRIAGTIVRHMRVRASLSEQDAKDILKFLAP
jgi:cytochrome c5